MIPGNTSLMPTIGELVSDCQQPRWLSANSHVGVCLRVSQLQLCCLWFLCNPTVSQNVNGLCVTWHSRSAVTSVAANLHLGAIHPSRPSFSYYQHHHLLSHSEFAPRRRIGSPWSKSLLLVCPSHLPPSLPPVPTLRSVKLPALDQLLEAPQPRPVP